jgi:hypothetical protein
MKNFKKILIVIIFTSLVGYICYEFWLPKLFNYYFFEMPLQGRSFDKADWIDAEKGNDWEQFRKDQRCIKGSMVSDLKKNYLKRHITSKAEIINLLGIEEKRYFKGKNCLAYSLGMCLGFGMDYDYLFLCFDEKDILSDIYVRGLNG